MGGILSALYGGSAAAETETDSQTSPVLKFTSTPRWQLHFNSIKDSSQLLVVDFSASWCGPCRMIEPAFNSMAEKFSDVSFVKLDVDQLPDVAKEFNVTAMPTFVLLKSGKEVDRIIGAKTAELEKKVVKFRGS